MELKPNKNDVKKIIYHLGGKASVILRNKKKYAHRRLLSIEYDYRKFEWTLIGISNYKNALRALKQIIPFKFSYTPGDKNNFINKADAFFYYLHRGVMIVLILLTIVFFIT